MVAYLSDLGSAASVNLIGFKIFLMVVIKMGRYSLLLSGLIGLNLLIQICGAVEDDGSDPIFESSDRDFTKSYKTISNYLTRFVPIDDIELNMKAAKDMMRIMKEDPKADDRLLAALELFISLQEAQGKCNESGYNILFANLLATEQRGRRSQSEYRTDRVVYQACLSHARICQSKYLTNFNSLYSKLDSTKKYRVDLFLEDTNLQIFMPGAKDRYMFFNTLVKNQQVIRSRDGTRLAYDAINILSIGDPDQKFLKAKKTGVNRDKVTGLFRKYLLEPCQYYVNELGPDVYIPAIFDAMFFHRVNEKEYRFYKSWAQFKLCEYVIDNQEPFENNLTMLAEVM